MRAEWLVVVRRHEEYEAMTRREQFRKRSLGQKKTSAVSPRGAWPPDLSERAVTILIVWGMGNCTEVCYRKVM